jgi:hypothetical protein
MQRFNNDCSAIAQPLRTGFTAIAKRLQSDSKATAIGGDAAAIAKLFRSDSEAIAQ